MNEPQWLSNVKTLTERADAFVDEDVVARDLNESIRSHLHQLADKDVNFSLFLKGLGSINQATSASERHDSERNSIILKIKQLETELSRYIRNLETNSLAIKLSSQSVSISKRMVLVSVISVAAVLFSGGTSMWIAWENHNVVLLLSAKQCEAFHPNADQKAGALNSKNENSAQSYTPPIPQTEATEATKIKASPPVKLTRPQVITTTPNPKPTPALDTKAETPVEESGDQVTAPTSIPDEGENKAGAKEDSDPSE